MTIDKDYLDKFGKLSQLDLSVMQQVADGVKKDDIASSHNLTVTQLYSKIAAVKKKIGVNTTLAAVLLLQKEKLIKT